MNCCSEIFSLEDFFASAYACNQYFWDILAILSNFLAPGFAQKFLNGMTAVGQNSGVSSFMPGIIHAFSKITANDPTEGVTKAQDIDALRPDVDIHENGAESHCWCPLDLAYGF